MARKVWVLLFGVWAVASVSCSSDDTSEPVPMDASTQADAGMDPEDAGMDPADAGDTPTATAIIGTGEQGFNALSENDPVEFILGSQSTGDRMGGFHIWGAVETDGIDPDNPTVTFKVFDEASGVERASATRTRSFIPSGQGTFVFFGVALILNDCCLATGAQLRMEVEVVDKNGVTASDQVVVVGDNLCPNDNQQNVCP